MTAFSPSRSHQRGSGSLSRAAQQFRWRDLEKVTSSKGVTTRKKMYVHVRQADAWACPGTVARGNARARIAR